MQRRQFIMALASGAAFLAPFSGGARSDRARRGVRLTLDATASASSGRSFHWNGSLVVVPRGANRLEEFVGDGAVRAHAAVPFGIFDAAPMADGSLLVAPMDGGIARVGAQGRIELLEAPRTPFASTTRLASDGQQWMAWDATNRLLRLPSGSWQPADEVQLKSVRQIVSLGVGQWAIVDSIGGQVLLLEAGTWRRFRAWNSDGFALSLGDVVSTSAEEVVVATLATDTRTFELQEVV